MQERNPNEADVYQHLQQPQSNMFHSVGHLSLNDINIKVQPSINSSSSIAMTIAATIQFTLPFNTNNNTSEQQQELVFSTDLKTATVSQQQRTNATPTTTATITAVNNIAIPNQTNREQQITFLLHQQQGNITTAPNPNKLNTTIPNVSNNNPINTTSVSTMSTNGGSTVESERNKRIKHQLILLLHVFKCSGSSGTDANGQAKQTCAVNHCSTMKQVMAHITQCTKGRSCTRVHCASSRQILAHWKNCTNADCPVCHPIRSTMSNNNHDGQQLNNDMFNNQPIQQPQQQQQQPSFSNKNMINQPINNNNLPTTAQELSSTAFSATTSSNQPATANATNIFPQQPQQPKVSKPWHGNINTVMRRHLIQKIIQTIFPTQDARIYKDPLLANLVNYAVRTECVMYEQAEDQEQYFHLLAEQINKILREFQVKERAAKARQAAQQAAAAGGQP
jgi:E1A/CREB-binding protein